MSARLHLNKPLVIAVVAGALAGAGGFLMHWHNAGPDAAPVGASINRAGGPAAAASMDALWAAQMKDLSGRPVNLAAYKGRPLVVNFWASWCAPCIEEMPDFQRASQTDIGKRAQFVGIGIDSAVKMRPFADKLGITYILLESDAAGLDLVRAVGNPSGALPFTLILDRTGAPVVKKLGKLEYAELMSVLAGL